jgi:ABC-type ATPase with predicted acetyltransferase domain
VNLDRFDLPDDRTVIDCLDGDFMIAIRRLCAVGLGSVYSMLNRPCYLSDGQKYRFRLALAMAAGKPFIFADEFCCGLDRITAGTVAYNLHKFAKRTETTLILASSREDILVDLAPDVIVVKDFCDQAQVTYKDRR